ncbi:MAG: NTP transferase domain-containing protein, partial [Candidatus Omnitrophica bacterium]|nr:NTP transferase domain-containing protein [Candidatus Omnitrophota bacterium]
MKMKNCFKKAVIFLTAFSFIIMNCVGLAGAVVDLLRPMPAMEKNAGLTENETRIIGAYNDPTGFRQRHVIRVADAAIILARGWNDLHPQERLTEEDMQLLRTAALAHDIGYNLTTKEALKHASDVVRQHGFRVRGQTLEGLRAQFKAKGVPLTTEIESAEKVFFEHPQLSCEVLKGKAAELGVVVTPELEIIISHHAESSVSSFQKGCPNKLILLSQLLQAADTIEASNNQEGGLYGQKVMSAEKTTADLRGKCQYRQISPEVRDVAIGLILRENVKLCNIILSARASPAATNYTQYPHTDKVFIEKELKRQRLASLLGDPNAYRQRYPEVMALACDILDIQNPSQFAAKRPVRGIILAAGRGARLQKSGTYTGTKALYPLNGKPMLMYILDDILVHDKKPVVVVSRDNKDEIQTALSAAGYDVEYVIQDMSETAVTGTGAAVLVAGQALRDFDGDLIVNWGDNVTRRPETFRDTLLLHEATGSAFTLPTAVLEKPATNIIKRAPQTGQPIGSIQKLDMPNGKLPAGEVDLGLFFCDARQTFRSLAAMRQEGAGRTKGSARQELGFPLVMTKMAQDNLVTCAVNCAEPLEAGGVNDIEEAGVASRSIEALNQSPRQRIEQLEGQLAAAVTAHDLAGVSRLAGMIESEVSKLSVGEKIAYYNPTRAIMKNLPLAKPDETVLVTGAAGFIGSHLVEELLKKGYRVIGLDVIN